MRKGEVIEILGTTPHEMDMWTTHARKQGWLPTNLLPQFKGPGHPIDWSERDVHVFAMLRQLRSNPHLGPKSGCELLQKALRTLESTSPLPQYLLVSEYGCQIFWSRPETASAIESLDSGSYFMLVNEFFETNDD